MVLGYTLIQIWNNLKAIYFCVNSPFKAHFWANYFPKVSYLPATCAFSIYASAASKPLSWATALDSVTNLLVSPRYLPHSGLFSSSILWKSFRASSYPFNLAFQILKQTRTQMFYNKDLNKWNSQQLNEIFINKY